MKWLDAASSRLRLLAGRRAAESRMEQEFQLHIDLETERLVREQGLQTDEARRQALVVFGGVETHKEALRDGRGLAWLGGFSLDLKLAARMLAKYPWLTLVGGVSLAFGIAVGVAAFEIRTQFVDPALPLDEGERIVGIRHWDASLSRAVSPSAQDFANWRDELTLVEDVSAFISLARNLVTDEGSRPELVAAMSPSAFRVVRVPPLLGRTIVEADDDPAAPPVVVLGHDIWTRRFAADPSVIGRLVRLGTEQAHVVGVMPEGFAFPAAHDLWVPLRGHIAGSTPEQALAVFGRLVRGASRKQAQAELAVIGLRTAADFPDTHEHVRPEVVPYARLIFDSFDVLLGLDLINGFVLTLLVLVSANVALLTFARAASRESEIAVRGALGAGRARIVAQLFVEGLALAGLAVAVGVVGARIALRSILALHEANGGPPLPFWISDSLTPPTVIYAGAMTMLCAAIIGVIPALRLTGSGQLARLRESAPGGGGFRFGGIWTAVIASQVAVTLMFPAAAFFFHRVVVGEQTRDVGFPSETYLSARLELDRGSAVGVPLDTTEQAFRAREIYAELERRVRAEPEVAALTFADRLPGMQHPRWRIEADGQGASEPSSIEHRVSSASVALNYFQAFDAPILAGRAFTTADLESASGVVVVNQSLVNQVFDGRNPLGRRIRGRPVDGADEAGPWLEIVGVVRDLGMGPDPAGLYRPWSPEAASAVRLAIRVRGTPESFGARFRAVVGYVAPALQISDLMSVDALRASQWVDSQYMSRLLVGLSAIALLLSLTAIYSVMAFTVTRRTREIGIRVALGADRRRVVGVIMRRPLAQVSIGIVAGGVLVAVTFLALFESAPTATEAMWIAVYAVVMMGVCLLACIVPARRALGVEPARVLAVEG
jgi:putative ABC transport system permease protein